MTSTKKLLVLALLVVGSAGAFADASTASDRPRHHSRPAQHGGTVVTLCDGETTYELAEAPGQEVPPDEAKHAADALMAEWRQKNPDKSWDDAPVLLAQQSPRSPPVIPPQPNPPSSSPVQQGGTSAESGAPEVPNQQRTHIQQGTTYGAYGPRDVAIWQASTDAFIEEGNRIFHDVKQLGGTTGMSCDMCHPNAANTHPETYPKYQVQLGRVALLRDMINWCIENPVRGKALRDDDPKLKALEAFIYAQRKGVPLEYGKH